MHFHHSVRLKYHIPGTRSTNLRSTSCRQCKTVLSEALAQGTPWLHNTHFRVQPFPERERYFLWWVTARGSCLPLIRMTAESNIADLLPSEGGGGGEEPVVGIPANRAPSSQVFQRIRCHFVWFQHVVSSDFFRTSRPLKLTVSCAPQLYIYHKYLSTSGAICTFIGAHSASQQPQLSAVLQTFAFIHTEIRLLLITTQTPHGIPSAFWVVSFFGLPSHHRKKKLRKNRNRARRRHTHASAPKKRKKKQQLAESSKKALLQTHHAKLKPRPPPSSERANRTRANLIFDWRWPRETEVDVSGHTGRTRHSIPFSDRRETS